VKVNSGSIAVAGRRARQAQATGRRAQESNPRTSQPDQIRISDNLLQSAILHRIERPAWLPQQRCRATGLIAQNLIGDKVAANYRTNLQLNRAIVVWGQAHGSERSNRPGATSGMQVAAGVSLQ
jgi:hypothetical protein